jgi:NDP-sugar pyrophosphorylase family protein
MFINIITPCSRPQNLETISKSINISRDNYRWIVVFDALEVPENIPNNCEAYAIKNSNSTIIEPCFIGDNVSIENSIIGPHVSIGSNCKVINSIVKNSIIQNDVKLTNANIANSMLGNGAEVSGKALNLSISDYTQIVA